MIMNMMVSRENLQFNLDSKLWMRQKFIFGRPGSKEFANTYVWEGIELKTMHESWVITLRPSSSLYINTVLDSVYYVREGVYIDVHHHWSLDIHIFRRMVLIIMSNIFRSL